MLLDTCFLIDLQREFSRKSPGAATAFLKSHPEAGFRISVVSVAEFLEGFEHTSEGERLLRAYARIDVDSRVAAQAAVFRRLLRRSGNLIGDFDILIGATAVVEGLPLVTDNREHFGRLPGLELAAYWGGGPRGARG